MAVEGLYVAREGTARRGLAPAGQGAHRPPVFPVHLLSTVYHLPSLFGQLAQGGGKRRTSPSGEKGREAQDLGAKTVSKKTFKKFEKIWKKGLTNGNESDIISKLSARHPPKPG